MKSFFSAALLATGAAASAVLDKPLVAHDNDHHLFVNEGHHAHQKTFPGRIPTSYESAVLGRRILALTPIGITATVFPDDTNEAVDPRENRPLGLKGVPVGLPEYIAACEEDDPEQAGNPTLLAITIATTFKNARAGSNVSLALQWEPPHEPASRSAPWWSSSEDEAAHSAAYSAASLPRFSLFGYFEPIEGQDLPTSSLARCFVKTHSDAKYWLPGNPIHESAWARLVVTAVYWVGGFGDRAYIGWIPIEEWRAVTKAEYEKVRLPGETKGWKAWDL